MKFTWASLCKILEQRVASMSLGDGPVAPSLRHGELPFFLGTPATKDVCCGPSSYHSGRPQACGRVGQLLCISLGVSGRWDQCPSQSGLAGEGHRTVRRPGTRDGG